MSVSQPPPPPFVPRLTPLRAESHDTGQTPHTSLCFCYDIVTAVAGGGCHGNLEMIGSAVHWQEARWGRGMREEGWVQCAMLGRRGQLGGFETLAYACVLGVSAIHKQMDRGRG